MLRRRAEDGASFLRRDLAGWVAALASLGVCALVIVLSPPDQLDSLSVILGIAAVAAGILVVGEKGGLAMSASFIVIMLAAAFLGPASAAAVAVIAELTATVMLKTRWRTVVFTNLPPAVVSPVIAAVIIRSLSSTQSR